MKLIKLIVSITLLFLSFSGVYCQEKIETRNTLRLSAGRFYSAIIELQKFYGGGSYTRKFGKFEIGGQVGMRYATYRMTPVSTVEQVNMIGRTDDFQTDYPFGGLVFLTTLIGDRRPAFKESRFFQTYAHLFVERNFKIYKKIYASLALGPSLEYGDLVFPAHAQTARVSGFYGDDMEVRLYDFLLHRYFAYGWMAAGRFKYDFENVLLAAGLEFANYPNGNRFYSPFVEVIVPF